MDGIIIVRPDTYLTSEELENYQQKIVKMLDDGVVVLQHGCDFAYIHADDTKKDEKWVRML